MLSVAIYTLTWNRLGYTRKMFDGLKKAGYPFDHFVVDNGSEDGTQGWLRKQKLQGLILNRENRGIIGATRQIRDTVCEYDMVVKVDNDCEILTEDWLARMVNVFEKLDGKCLLNPTRHGVIRNLQMAGESFEVAGEPVDPVVFLGGILMVLSPAVLREVDMDPANHSMHSLDDSLMSSVGKGLGMKLLRLPGIEVNHMDGSHGQYDVYPEYCKQRDLNRVRKYKDENPNSN